MIKRHFFLIAAGIFLGLMVLAAVLRVAFAQDETGARGGPGGPGGRGQQISQIVVAPRAFSDQIEVLGVARGNRSVNITSATSQLITRVLFTDGQRVSAGTRLVELQADEQDADIILARAQVNQAQNQYDRYSELGDRGFAPRMMVEQFQTELRTAQANLAAAQARRGDRSIRAPFSGVLGLSSVTAGTLINPGAIITTLDDISTIRVDFPVPERYLSSIQAGLPITATADAYGEEEFSGRIALIDTRINEQTRAVTARAEFPNPGSRIRPGMLIRVSVQQGRRQSAAVPESALQYQGDSAFVFRIVAGDDGTTAQRVAVERGVVENGFVEIVSGLRVGDRIVGSGLNRIQPNAPVTVAQAPARATTTPTVPMTAAAR